MGTLRTEETELTYKKLIGEGILTHGCPLCAAESLKDFKHWRIITNAFPYDRIAKVHHMVIPRRHVQNTGLTAEEKEEFDVIKK